MNLKIVEQKKINMRINKNGLVTLSLPLVRILGLNSRKFLFALDEDDKERKYIYLTIDETGQSPNAYTVSKKTSGTYQLPVTELKKTIRVKGTSVNYSYSKKIIEMGKPYFQFERDSE